MHTIGISRKQVRLASWEDFVPADSPARQIDRFVDEMDTSYFLFSSHDTVGRRPYNPKDMLKLFLYGNDKGVFSSRKLERECRENVIVFWLLNGLQPESKTICNFRRNNAENLNRFFSEFARKLVRDGYIDGKVVGLDGTKIRANNSGNNNFNLKRVTAKIEKAEKQIADYMSEVDKNDKLDGLVSKHEKLVSIKQRIENGETEVSTTDPDSRMMKMPNGGKNVCHNVQSAVDSKNKMIAGFKVVSNQNDQGLLHSVAKEVKENLGLKKMMVTADTGYFDADEIEKCHLDNIETLITALEPHKNSELYTKKDFVFDEQIDAYLCPAGQKLTLAAISNDTKHYRNIKACKDCPLKSKCTKGVYRTVSHHVKYETVKRNAYALVKNAEKHRLRGALCEHPFGTIKHNMRFVQFLLRTNPKVSGEAALFFTVYNLKRLRNLSNNNLPCAQTQAILEKLRFLFAFVALAISVFGFISKKFLRKPQN